VLEQTNILNSSVSESSFLVLGAAGTIGQAVTKEKRDCPTVWNVNGAIYIFPIDKFKTLGLKNIKQMKYPMNKVSSIDIDDVDDWFLAESLLKNGYNPTKPEASNQ